MFSTTARSLLYCVILLILGAPSLAGGDKDDKKEHGDEHKEKGHHSSLIEDGPAYFMPVEEMPKRPKPPVELGEPFLGTGTLWKGFTLPTGATWQPQFVAFGSFRSAVQTTRLDFGNGASRTTEWANRLDLFGNLALSGSERVVFGFRNLDQDGTFSGYVFESENNALEEGSVDEINADIQSLFFEGDLGEIFPNLSPDDFRSTDIGIAVGRQPLLFQEGLLINDSIDGVGLTRNTLLPGNTANFRITAFYGWDNIHRQGVDDSGQMFGILTSTDFRLSTVDIDAVYVSGDNGFDDLTVAGISAVQRIGLIATSFRVAGSFSDNANEEGAVFLTEISWIPHHTFNHAYINAFVAMDNFVPAATGPGTGGPLARAGINFAGVGLGNYGAPLTSQASDIAGGAIGYQMFFAGTRKQLILEAGGGVGLEDNIPDQYAVTARFQSAFGKHFVFIVDAFANDVETFGDTGFGGRLELLTKF